MSFRETLQALNVIHPKSFNNADTLNDMHNHSEVMEASLIIFNK